MNKTIEIVTAILLVCILTITIHYTITETKKNEEFRNSQRAIRDSLLAKDSLCIKCARCSWNNYRTMLWFKDSIQ